jgi:hypothetical protein
MKIWKITADFYHDSDAAIAESVREPNRTGTWGDAGRVYPICDGSDRHGGIGHCPLTDADMPVEFGLFSDMDELMYEGRMTEELLDSIFVRAPLEQFGKPYAEAVDIRIRNPRPLPTLDEQGGVIDNDEWFEIQ